jgi:predicted O-methyltransferase YrrM
MKQEINQPYPAAYQAIVHATENAGFTMASDVHTCSLLKTLAASKPGGRFLELGTGSGLSTAWILDGMDAQSTLVSIDHDDVFLSIARESLGKDERLSLVLSDGAAWIAANRTAKFDYIFADTWHGKYLLLEETLDMLNAGGFYIIDDMLPQSNWPEGHDVKAQKLLEYLDQRADFSVTRQVWASGIVVAVKLA